MLGAIRVKPLLSLSAVVAMTSEAIAPVSSIQANDASLNWHDRTSLADALHRIGPVHIVPMGITVIAPVGVAAGGWWVVSCPPGRIRREATR
jgi:hypothetical protein